VLGSGAGYNGEEKDIVFDLSKAEDGETMLIVNGDAYITVDNVSITFKGVNPALRMGDTVILLEATMIHGWLEDDGKAVEYEFYTFQMKVGGDKLISSCDWSTQIQSSSAGP